MFAVYFAFSANRVAQAQFNVVDDFSNTDNTATSTWSYRYGPDLARDGDYPLLSFNSDPRPYWDPPTPYWNRGTADVFIPGVGVNRSGAAKSPFNVSPFSWPDSTVWMHPTVEHLAIVTWLSPVSGVIDIDFQFTDIDAGSGNGIRYFIDLGDSTGELTSGTIPNGGTSGALLLTDVAVEAGDRIHFIVDPNLATGSSDWDSTTLTATITPQAPEEIEAEIDIKPNTDPNSINLGAKGLLPVAVLSSEEFDAADIDVDTILFGDPLLILGDGEPVSPVKTALEDIDGDGLDDLILHFSIPEIKAKGALDQDSEEAVLIGETTGGTPFAGTDAVQIVKPK